MANITGIQDPSTFNLSVLQTGASNQAARSPMGISQQPTTSTNASTSKLEDELAQIRAIGQSTPQSGGLGQTIGGAAGMGIGSAIAPGAGTAVGGAAGQAVGGIVDYMIQKDADEKAEAKRKEALKKRIEREKAIANSRAIAESKARRMGIALTREEQARTAQDVINEERRNMLSNLINSINQKAQQDEMLKQKFLKSRRIA